MKIGIMGGTFDPVHTGHLLVGEIVRQEAHLDEIWFIPAKLPPHKEHSPFASEEQRWEMVTRAVNSNPHFRAIDYELKNSGTSYTYHTVMQLKNLHSDKSFSFIIGGDMVQDLPNWYRIEELVKEIGFIGLNRAGFSIDWDALSNEIKSAVSMVYMPAIDVSSTLIRARMARGLSVKYMVPDPVLLYMKEQHLYES